MLRRSEDLFLEKIYFAVASKIKEAIEKVEQGSHDEAWQALAPLVAKEDKAAIYYMSTFSVPGESLEHFEKRRIEQLKRSAEYGYAPAIHELAIHYDSGELVPRDIEKAAKLFRQAAEKGHPHAQWIHGLDLIYGRNGIEKNEKLGVEYLERSAKAKFIGALESVSGFYENGMHGYPVDKKKARFFREKADGDDVIGY